MDEQVIRYYRKLLRSGFEYVGSLENPSIFLDTVGEKIRICGHNSKNYLHIYILILNKRIEEVKYFCTCDPAANVVVEIFCKLIKGRTLREAEMITTDMFSQEAGSTGEEFLKKSAGIIDLLQRGLTRYRQGKPEPFYGGRNM